jgi:uncharacterized SAM-binding protein YcdF (DUF218 family)
MTSRQVLRSVVLLTGWGLVGGILLVGYMAIRISAQGDRDEKRPADAIVVLGAAQFDGTPGGVFEARLRHAVDLYHEGLARYLIVTGGKLPGDRTTEAATARAWAVAHGVPDEAILDEDKGRNTLASLEAVAQIMRNHDLTSALFVSDRTHMLRVLRMAADQGIVAWGSPTESSPTDRDEWRRRKAMVHELAGLAAYYVGAGRLINDAANDAAP